MIHTRNELLIEATPQRIFELASDTARWPEILPHYRCVRTIEDLGSSKIIEMSAKRDWIPVRWTAQQWNDSSVPSIRFVHLAGWTAGMDVEWRFEHRGEGTLVTIVHDLDFAFPIASDFLGKHVVSDFFVHNIASKTLRRIKSLVEDA